MLFEPCISSFDKAVKSQSSKKIWGQFSSLQFQVQNLVYFQKEDVIEYTLQCHRISQKKDTLKPIGLFLGQDTLYFVEKEQPSGMLALSFTTMQIKNRTPQPVVSLYRNQQNIDLVVENLEEFINHFRKKCILTTFHDDFIVEKLIGNGSVAKVYLASKITTGAKYAVKVFNKAATFAKQKGKESMENEMKVMRRFNQENLLHLHEVHETLNSIYFVMELVTGGELFSLGAVFSLSRIQGLIYNLLKALKYMHSKGCMHRDIKPQNLLLKSKESKTDIVIADFELTAFLDEKNILFKRCGTPGFVAPEVLQYATDNEFYNEKCDIFSAGTILYLLVTGQSPFEGKDLMKTMERNKVGIVNYDVYCIKRAPKALLSLMKKMLNTNPKKRFSAEQCLQHRYFQELFPQELLQDDIQTPQYNRIVFTIEQNNLCIGEKGTFQLITTEQQWDGNIESIGSLTNYSHSNSPNRIERLQTNLSRFGQFSQQMEAIQRERTTPNKKNQETLHKAVLKNTYLKKQYSNEEQQVAAQQSEAVQVKKQPLKGCLKKSNSLNI